MSIAEPELGLVVQEQVDQPEPQRLPARARRLGQLGLDHASASSGCWTTAGW